jgi:hypothetical protein
MRSPSMSLSRSCVLPSAIMTLEPKIPLRNCEYPRGSEKADASGPMSTADATLCDVMTW